MANAILVADMIKGFCEPGHPLYVGDSIRAIIPGIQQLLERELKLGSKIFYICDSHAPNDPEFMMFLPHCIEGTEETRVIPELALFPGEIIRKHRYSAFFSTHLDERLREIHPDKLILCGDCTSICVLFTAADAINRGYPVEVYTDCVADFDPEAHVFALRHMEKVLGVRLKSLEKRRQY